MFVHFKFKPATVAQPHKLALYLKPCFPTNPSVATRDQMSQNGFSKYIPLTCLKLIKVVQIHGCGLKPVSDTTICGVTVATKTKRSALPLLRLPMKTDPVVQYKSEPLVGTHVYADV